MREKILEILAKYSILPEAVGDMIFKDQAVAFTVDIAVLQLAKNEAEKIVKICENEIKKAQGLLKVTIILIAEGSPKGASNKDLRSDNSNFRDHSHSHDHSNSRDHSHSHDHSHKSSETLSQNQPQKNLLGQEILPVVGVKKIIAVASAKGGVGKSTLAVNLAIALKKIGRKVALVDADIYGPSVPHLMRLQGKPENKDGLLLPLVSHDIKCISIGSLIDTDAAGIWRGPMVTKILYQLIRSINWRADNHDVDVMIIDMPPGTGDVYMSLAEKFPLAGVVIVSTPQSLAVIDVVRSIDCFNKLKIPILGLIQNMSYLENNGVRQYIFGKDGAKDLARKMNINFLGEVPLVQEIADSSDNQTPFLVSDSSNKNALEIGQIAEKILDLI